MTKAKTFLLLVCTILTVTTFAQIDQKPYVTGLHKTVGTEPLQLLLPYDIKQTRGAIKTDYRCQLPKGMYTPVFDSDSGRYYIWVQDGLLCEDYTVGGIYIHFNGSAYTWTCIAMDKGKFLEKIKDEKYARKLEKFTNPKRPFVHVYYPINMNDIRVPE